MYLHSMNNAFTFIAIILFNSHLVYIFLVFIAKRYYYATILSERFYIETYI